MLLGPVMSLVSNCDDTHVIEVGVFEQRAGGGGERLSSTFVKPPAPRPPLGFPVWLESKTDGPNGRWTGTDALPSAVNPDSHEPVLINL